MTLPPIPPLTEKERTDPLLQPLYIAPPVRAGDDYWDVVIGDNAQSKTCENLADVFEFIQEHWRDVDYPHGTISIYRHKRGEVI